MRLTSTTACQSPRDTSSKRTAGAPAPALLNSTSIRPNALYGRANSASHRCLVGDVGRYRDERAPARRARAVSASRIRAAAGQHDAEAGLGECDRCGSADSRTRRR